MTKIVGHRGAPEQAPENTLASFRRAIDLGVDAVEFDVRSTSDGRLVVIHDRTVNRTTDGTGPVSTFSYDELSRLDAGEGEHVPLLDDVLATLQGTDTEAQVELKEPDIAGDVVQAVHDYDLEERCIITSFHRAALDGIDLPTGYACTEPGPSLITATREIDCDVILPRYSDDNLEQTRKHIDGDVSYGFWSVDGRQEIENVLRSDAYSFTTDQPATALKVRDELQYSSP